MTKIATTTTTRITIDGCPYEVPKNLGGVVLEAVVALEGHLKPGEWIGDAEILKPFLRLRVEALAMGVPYVEHPWEEIKYVSYEVMEMEDDDRGSSPGTDPLAIALRLRQRKKYNKDKRERAQELLPQVLASVGYEKLEWLNAFHTEARDPYEEVLLEHPKFKGILDALLLRERDKNPEVQPYHIIPEIIDWNLYVGVRGSTLAGAKYEKYCDLLDLCYKLETTRRLTQVATTFLDAHPDLVPIILQKGYAPHIEYPQDPESLRALYKDAQRRMRLVEQKCVRQILAQRSPLSPSS